MNLYVLRFSSQKDSTSGLLFNVVDNKLNFLCYTLEDEKREDKVNGETRIPEGEYEVLFRKEGGFHNKYKDRFSSIHQGMLEVKNVPNFEYILLHCGNDDRDTAGCLLLGDSQENNIIKPKGWIGSSSQAYKRVYPIIANELSQGNKVTIKYKNL
jgi:hypothetical protein|tara:strand:- start:2112 stop:2576 length:465 start_codon:yes stop_codon:yes gene_type:complete